MSATQILTARPTAALLDLMLRVHERFVHDVTDLDTGRLVHLPPGDMRVAIRGAADAACQKVCRRAGIDLSAIDLSAIEHEWLVESVIDEAFGLGPLECLLRNPAITAILIRAPHEVLVERAGGLDPTTVAFRDRDHVHRVLDRIRDKQCVKRTGPPGQVALRVDIERLREAAARRES